MKTDIEHLLQCESKLLIGSVVWAECALWLNTTALQSSEAGWARELMRGADAPNVNPENNAVPVEP